MAGTHTRDEIEAVTHAWEAALAAHDLDALLACYASEAVLESPVAAHIQGSPGVCRGHEQLRPFLAEVVRRTPEVRQYHRAGFFTDGHRATWEYPRLTPTGEQMDFVEVMEIADGLIHAHRVYWGWKGVDVLASDEYHRDGPPDGWSAVRPSRQVPPARTPTIVTGALAEHADPRVDVGERDDRPTGEQCEHRAVTDHQDPDISADLAAFPVMRAVLRARVDGTGATHSEVRGIVDDLEQRLGRDAVVALVGSLATKALAPLEDRARQAGTQVAAEIDAGEQHALAVLDQHRRGTSGM